MHHGPGLIERLAQLQPTVRPTRQPSALRCNQYVS
jgi:hypothetical protein